MNERASEGLRPLPFGGQNIDVYEDIAETDLAIAEAESELANVAALLNARDVLRAVRRRYIG